MYKQIFGSDCVLLTRDDGSQCVIPADPRNVDCADYLAWCEKGNKPEAPDPPAPPPVRDVDTVDPATRAELLGFKGMTPADLETWVEKNVVDMPSAIAAIKNLAIAVSILYRR